MCFVVEKWAFHLAFDVEPKQSPAMAMKFLSTWLGPNPSAAPSYKHCERTSIIDEVEESSKRQRAESLSPNLRSSGPLTMMPSTVS